MNTHSLGRIVCMLLDTIAVHGMYNVQSNSGHSMVGSLSFYILPTACHAIFDYCTCMIIHLIEGDKPIPGRGLQSWSENFIVIGISSRPRLVAFM